MHARRDTVTDEMNIEGIVNDYKLHGIARVESFFSPDEVAIVHRQIERYKKETMPGLPPELCVREKDGKEFRNLWYMNRHDPFFQELAERPSILELVARLVNGVPVVHQVETFNKAAGVGSAVPCHQDNSYFWQTPPDMLTIWVAIDEATMEQGAMWYVPDSHESMRPCKATGVAGNSMGVDGPPNPQRLPLMWATGKPGDAYIHHCQTVHGSSPNKSSKPRCALLMVYRAAHTITDARLKALYNSVRVRDGLPVVP